MIRKSAVSPPPKTAVERREDILSAARDLFYSRGFEAGSLRELALGMRFTQAALYYHFKSKDEIFFNVLDYFTSHVLNSLTQSLGPKPTSVIRFCNTIRLHVTISRNYNKDVKLLIEDRKLLSADYAKVIKRKERRIFELYRERISALMKSRDFESVSPTVMTFTLLSAVNSVYQWYEENGALTIEEIADQTLQILLGGILTAKGRKALPADLAKLLPR